MGGGRGLRFEREPRRHSGRAAFPWREAREGYPAVIRLMRRSSLFSFRSIFLSLRSMAHRRSSSRSRLDHRRLAPKARRRSLTLIRATTRRIRPLARRLPALRVARWAFARRTRGAFFAFEIFVSVHRAH